MKGGFFLLALLLWHTAEKIQSGILPEMLWTCHLATALSVVGFLGKRPVLVMVGGMFHLFCGLPAWILECFVNGTTLSSAALHLCTPAAGLWVIRREGLSEWAWKGGIGLWVAGFVAGRCMDPGLNINLAWAPYSIWEVPPWFSHLVNLGLVSGSLWVGQKVLGRIL